MQFPTILPTELATVGTAHSFGLIQEGLFGLGITGQLLTSGSNMVVCVTHTLTMHNWCSYQERHVGTHVLHSEREGLCSVSYSAVTVTPGTSAPKGGVHAPGTGQGGMREGV